MSDDPTSNARRHFTQKLGSMVLLYPLFSCAAGVSRDKKLIELSYVKYNYTDRLIFDIFLNGHGGGLAPAHGGGNSVMLFTPFELGGPQTLTWRDAETGETVTARNQLSIPKGDVLVKEGRPPYIAIHIYPDQTAELTFTNGAPPPTPRGAGILKEQGL